MAYDEIDGIVAASKRIGDAVSSKGLAAKSERWIRALVIHALAFRFVALIKLEWPAFVTLRNANPSPKCLFSLWRDVRENWIQPLLSE
jgi:hypothetical protein